MSNIVVDTSDGFVDIRFPIIEAKVSTGGEATLVVGGKISEELVEITFRLIRDMLPNDLFAENASINSYVDGIRMLLDGDRGRSFVSALSRLYEAQHSSFLMPVELSFTAVALEGNPSRIATEPVKFKLFHETGSTAEDEGPDYFEIFLNIYIDSGFVELNEKDTDFRAGILNSFPSEPS
jgi:hypothetical protein